MAFPIVKVLSIAGTVLGIAGTVVSSYAGQKTQEATIEKKVAEALANQAKGS
jgi:hypothetical protein